MTRLKELLREPALLIDLGETLVVFLIAFGIGGLTGDDQSYLVAALIGLAGIAKACTTRPFAVTALTDGTRAVLVCAAAVFGVGLTSDQIVIVATLVGTLFSLVARGQITPRNSPVTNYAGSGAGPVTGESGVLVRGQSVLTSIGVLIIVVALFLFLLGLLGVLAFTFTHLIVGVVLGVALIVVDRLL